MRMILLIRAAHPISIKPALCSYISVHLLLVITTDHTQKLGTKKAFTSLINNEHSTVDVNRKTRHTWGTRCQPERPRKSQAVAQENLMRFNKVKFKVLHLDCGNSACQHKLGGGKNTAQPCLKGLGNISRWEAGR